MAFISDELNMTWKIMNELRRSYAVYDSHSLLSAGGKYRRLFMVMLWCLSTRVICAESISPSDGDKCLIRV